MQSIVLQLKFFLMFCLLSVTYQPVRTVEVMLKLNIKDNQDGASKVASVKFNIPKSSKKAGLPKNEVVRPLNERKRDSGEEDVQGKEEEEQQQKTLKYEKEDISEGESSPLSDILLPYRSGVPHPTKHRHDTGKHHLRLYNRHRLRYQIKQLPNVNVNRTIGAVQSDGIRRYRRDSKNKPRQL